MKMCKHSESMNLHWHFLTSQVKATQTSLHEPREHYSRNPQPFPLYPQSLNFLSISTPRNPNPTPSDPVSPSRTHRSPRSTHGTAPRIQHLQSTHPPTHFPFPNKDARKHPKTGGLRFRNYEEARSI